MTRDDEIRRDAYAQIARIRQEYQEAFERDAAPFVEILKLLPPGPIVIEMSREQYEEKQRILGIEKGA